MGRPWLAVALKQYEMPLRRRFTTLPVQLRRSLTWDQGAGASSTCEATDRYRIGGLLLRSAKPLAAWNEREHKRSSASVLSQGNRYHRYSERELTRSLPPSTADLERRSDGRRRLRLSMSYYPRSATPVLRRRIEPKLSAAITVKDQPRPRLATMHRSIQRLQRQLHVLLRPQTPADHPPRTPIHHRRQISPDPPSFR